MQELIEYIKKHVERGACTCGRCMDAPAKPETKQPVGHTADLIFFKVKAVNEPNAEEFKRLVMAHALQGSFGGGLNLFDDHEHSYIEIGGWIGDQGYALMLMGLGALLGAWDLFTPRVLIPELADDDPLMRTMVGQGFIIIQSKTKGGEQHG